MIGATLFSELPSAVRSRDEPRYEHPRWRVGDLVRPRPEWSDGQTPIISGYRRLILRYSDATPIQ